MSKESLPNGDGNHIIPSWLTVGEMRPHAHVRAERWLDARLRRGQKEQFGELAELTPELALMLLGKNPENRVLSRDIVIKYSSDIASGRWAVNGEAVIVSVEGYLNDGQHRCAAVIMADRPINTLFTFGVERDTRTTLDQGRVRTVGDYLAMDGGINTNNVAAIASRLLDIQRDGKCTTGLVGRPTKAEVLEFAREHYPDILAAYRAVHRKGANRLSGFSVLGTAYYMLARISQEDADFFFEKLITGEELKHADPILTLREKLLSPLRLNTNERLKAIFMAWNNFRAKRSARTLTHSMTRFEKLPVPK